MEPHKQALASWQATAIAPKTLLTQMAIRTICPLCQKHAEHYLVESRTAGNPCPEKLPSHPRPTIFESLIPKLSSKAGCQLLSNSRIRAPPCFTVHKCEMECGLILILLIGFPFGVLGLRNKALDSDMRFSKEVGTSHKHAMTGASSWAGT